MEESGDLDIKRYLRLIYKKRVLFAMTAMAVTHTDSIANRMESPSRRKSDITPNTKMYNNPINPIIKGRLIFSYSFILEVR